MRYMAFVGVCVSLISLNGLPNSASAQCWACGLSGLGNALQDIGAAGMQRELERQREENLLQLQHEQEMQRMQRQHDLEMQRLRAAQQQQLEQQKQAIQQQQRTPNSEPAGGVPAGGVKGYPWYLEKLNVPGLPPLPEPAAISSAGRPDPMSQLHVGNQTFTQTPAGPGPTYQTQGQQTLGSDGTLYTRAGNVTFGSNGTTGISSGNQTFTSGPNGQSRTCQTIGNQTLCN